MAQSRPSYAYNPDLPVRKWHQKWVNPLISLQNAPPASHGTPAPTKEDGEIGHAGFKIRTWIPMDEDDDVPEETLQQEVNWWNKPGAPVRPELRGAPEKPKVNSVPPVIVELDNVVADDVMQVDSSTEPAQSTNGVPKEVEQPDVSTTANGSGITSSPAAPPKEPATTEPIDTEMLDAEPSPVNPSALSPSSAVQQSPQPEQRAPPSLPAQSIDAFDAPPSPSKAAISPPTGPPRTEDALPSRLSPFSEPLAQPEETAAGPAIETPVEQVEHEMNPGTLGGADDAITNEDIVSPRPEDLVDVKDVVGERDAGQRTEVSTEDSAPVEGLNPEIMKDDV